MMILFFTSFTGLAADKILKAHQKEIWKIKFSSDGDFFLTTGGDGIVKMWWSSCLCPLTSFSHDSDSQVYDADFFPDGRVISSSLDGSIYIWFRETGEKLANIVGHSEKAPRVRVAKDGSRFFTASSDGHVRSYDSTSYQVTSSTIKTKSPMGIVAMVRGLLTVGLEGIFLWDEKDETKSSRISESPYYFTAEPLPGSDTQVLVGGNASEGGPLQIWDTETKQVLKTFQTVPGFFWQVAASRDGLWVGASAFQGITYVWNRNSGELVYQSPSSLGDTMSLDFFPEGRALLIGNAEGQAHLARF